MAISPPSDIVLDVARAADPQRLQLAYERLQKLSAPGAVGTQFASLVDETGEAARGLAGAREHFAAQAVARKAAALADDTPAAKTARQFEAQVATSFIEQIMPKPTAETYGSGLSGDVWRSMLAEQIAGQIAKGKGFGIREQVQAAIVAREAGATQAQAADAARHLPDRQVSSAGATGRDLNIPLAVEHRFLDILKPAAAGPASLTRKA